LSPDQAGAARIHHARQNLAAARWIAGETADQPGADPCPPEVRACNFWLLAAEPGHPQARESWFLPSGERLPATERLPAAEAFRQWVAHLRQPRQTAQPALPGETEGTPRDDPGQEPGAGPAGDPAPAEEAAPAGSVSDEKAPPAGDLSIVETPGNGAVKSRPPATPTAHPINHYILLPLYAWGAANWDLALVEPLMQESHPAIGFSLAEARLAKRVTVVGAEGAVSGEALVMLRQSGCQVERLLEDGTLIAT
jgi:hypothetical protein